MTMNPPSLRRLSLALALLALAAQGTARGAEASPKPKNWSPPSYRTQAQVLADGVMARHPELISVTLHGAPPGMPKVYTMFAGSYPDRIGNPDDPDDVMVIETGVTILDPRWHRTRDAQRKYVVQMPLRDASGENVGLLVLAYRNPPGNSASDIDFLVKATAIRDELQRATPSYDGLFGPAR
jgi:hypothetical protein